MTELKDLKVGDEVTLTVKAKVDIRGEMDGEQYAYFDFGTEAEYIVAGERHVKSGAVTIKRTPRPLPTEPGVYVPANNAKFPHSSWLYKLRGPGNWSCMSAAGILEDSEALEEAESAHENLGGLVRLVPEQ